MSITKRATLHPPTPQIVRLSPDSRQAGDLTDFDCMSMEANNDILGESDGDRQACSTSDRLAGFDEEDQQIILTRSAFRPVKISADLSKESFTSFPQPKVLSPPPFLPTSSLGWYSSFLSSLYRTGAQHNNNKLEQERESVKKKNEPAEGKGYKIWQ